MFYFNVLSEFRIARHIVQQQEEAYEKFLFDRTSERVAEEQIHVFRQDWPQGKNTREGL